MGYVILELRNWRNFMKFNISGAQYGITAIETDKHSVILSTNQAALLKNILNACIRSSNLNDGDGLRITPEISGNSVVLRGEFKNALQVLRTHEFIPVEQLDLIEKDAAKENVDKSNTEDKSNTDDTTKDTSLSR